MKIKIQKFKKGQAKKVSKLITDSFNEFVAPTFSKKAREQWLLRVTPEKLTKKSKSKKRDIYVAFYNNRIIGIIQGRKNYKIISLFVDKKFHKKKIGETLVDKIESIFRKRRVKIIKVWSSIYAVKFYEKMGYKKTRGIVKTETRRQQSASMGCGKSLRLW